MTYASSRFALLLIFLFIASGIAMMSLYQNPRLSDTCRDSAQLLAVSDLEVENYEVWLGGEGKGKKAGDKRGGNRNLRVDGYLKPTQPLNVPLSFTIRRTFVIPSWLLRPPSALPGPEQPDILKTVVVDIDGVEVPIQLAYAFQRGAQSFVAYALAYDAEPITSPFWVRTKDAPMSLVTGIEPITYIGVAGAVGRMQVERHEQDAIDFVTAGWRHYRKACAR